MGLKADVKGEKITRFIIQTCFIMRKSIIVATETLKIGAVVINFLFLGSFKSI